MDFGQCLAGIMREREGESVCALVGASHESIEMNHFIGQVDDVSVIFDSTPGLLKYHMNKLCVPWLSKLMFEKEKKEKQPPRKELAGDPREWVVLA